MRIFKVICLVVVLAAGMSVTAQTKDAAAPHVDVISIDGSINPAVDDFIRESVRATADQGASGERRRTERKR